MNSLLEGLMRVGSTLNCIAAFLCRAGGDMERTVYHIALAVLLLVSALDLKGDSKCK